MENNKTVAITLFKSDLVALGALSKFAASDDMIPLLTNVRFTWFNGRLVAYATDRYRVGEVTLSETVCDGYTHFEGDVLIPAKTVKTLASKFKLRKGERIVLNVDVEIGKWEFTDFAESVSGGFEPGTEFPLVERLFKADATAPVELMHVQPKFLADALGFMSGFDSKTPVLVTQPEGAGKPIQFSNEGARCLVMPVRADEGEDITGKAGRVWDVSEPFTPGDAVEAKPAPVEQVEAASEPKTTKTKTKPVKAKAPAKGATVKARMTRAKTVPNVTPKMLARLERKLTEGATAVEAVGYAVGTVEGKRAMALLEAIA